MRILVFSDTHGDWHTMRRVLLSNKNVDTVIHCGDGADEIDEFRMAFPEKKLIAVRGNCDWTSTLPVEELCEIGGKKIFVTHGHTYQAKFTIYNLVCAAREKGADILLFGHTHNALTDYSDGLYIMNPGSCHGYYATYGYIDITDKGDIVTNVVKVI